MSAVENLLREPTLERLEKFKKDEMREMGSNLELEVRGVIHWAELKKNNRRTYEQ